MSGTRVYVGHLASRATERDVEDFFRSYGKIRDIVLKSGFGFVEFSDSRDASDAVDDLNGRELCGERVVIQISRRPRESDRYGSDRRGPPGGGPPRRGERYGPPVQTRYRILIENLSTRCSWQDLKDMMRGAGEVTYADAHKKEPNTGVVCFSNSADLKTAMEKYQGREINGRRIKLIDDSESGGGRRSRSRSPRRSASRSRSPRSRSHSPRSRSRSGSR